jgi:hypothetical protein
VKRAAAAAGGRRRPAGGTRLSVSVRGRGRRAGSVGPRESVWAGRPTRLRAKKRKEKERWNGLAVEKERGGGLRAGLKER